MARASLTGFSLRLPSNLSQYSLAIYSSQPIRPLQLPSYHLRATFSTKMTIGGKSTVIHRSTMFKLPDPEGQKKLLEAYRVFGTEQQKDGKPYVRVSAGLALEDPRSRGYTVIADTEFASLDDMRFYDDECPAHVALKKKAATFGITEPPLTVYYEKSQN